MKKLRLVQYVNGWKVAPNFWYYHLKHGISYKFEDHHGYYDDGLIVTIFGVTFFFEVIGRSA